MQGRDPALPRRRVIAGLAAAALPGLVTHGARADTYREIFYQSRALRIAAYLYQPTGPGRFPVIIYNHGSREGLERQPVPWVRIAALYVDAGYAVLVPERRGYGRSDGPTWTDEVGRDTTSRFIARCQAEADDVLAAVDFLKTVAFVDASRLGGLAVGTRRGGACRNLSGADDGRGKRCCAGGHSELGESHGIRGTAA